MTGAIDPTLTALQPQSLDKLRYAAKKDPEGSMRQIAQQFESMFVSIMMKSMRQATTGNSLFDNEQTRLYTEMRDQQVAQKIATTGKGLGLADMLLAQMKRNAGLETNAVPAQPVPFKRDAVFIPLKTNLPGSDTTLLQLPQKGIGA